MRYKLSYISENRKSIDFTLENGYIITSCDALTGVDINIATSQSSGQVGSTVLGTQVQSKTALIEGVVLYQDTKSELLDVLAPMTSGTLVVNDEWALDVTIKSTVEMSKHQHNANFQFQVFIPIPYWYQYEDDLVTVSGIVKKFKFPFNMTKTWQFGERIRLAYMNAFNSSNVNVPFTFNFYAPVTVVNPYIENIETGEVIRINTTMQVGEVITVNTQYGRVSVISNIRGNVIRYWDWSNNTLFNLRPGDNLIKSGASTNGDFLETSISFRPVQSGVAV